MTKAISILGSTGSIGRQTLDVADDLGLRVAALSANRDVDRMEAQCRRYRPELAVLMEESAAKALKVRLADTTRRVASGMDGLLEAATLPGADTVVTAVSGMIGLRPTLAAIRERKRIALANKETLVCAGELVMQEAARCGAEIIPVDSEHSAIFQCLMGCRDQKEVRRLILTCSGGPFFGMTREALAGKTKDDALKHPNWKMGPKITVDCATLMNKGLEVIEAHYLFDVGVDDIRVVIHPQSCVHSMVEYLDGSVKAHLGVADMRIPIQFALSYPHRWESPAAACDFTTLHSLEFMDPDMQTFRCLALALEAGRAGGTLPCVMNAANEVAVAAFLKDACRLTDIDAAVEHTMEALGSQPVESLEQLEELDARARTCAATFLAQL